MSKFNRKSGIGGLMITRREGTRVTVNHGELIIEVVEIKGKQVRLAFKAAKDVIILREESELSGEIHPPIKR